MTEPDPRHGDAASDPAEPDAAVDPAAASAAPSESEEYPARVWPRIYTLVLALLAIDIVVFATLTWWYR